MTIRAVLTLVTSYITPPTERTGSDGPGQIVFWVPIHTAFPSSATRLMPFHEAAVSGSTGYHRAWAQYSYERGLSSNGSALHIEFHQSANQPLIGVYATTQNH